MMVTVRVLEVFAYGELGRCDGEGNLPSPWKDALTLSPASPQAAAQQDLPAVSLAMFGQAFLSTALPRCPADWPGGWQTQAQAGENASWWEGTPPPKLRGLKRVASE